ncbi:uncharacterized protein LOC144631294 isoform X2 [Oculina patagonica]
MGRRAKDKQLVAQASRRRTVLQIDRVSRREVGEAPVTSGVTRTINPNSITGIGLLGSYADHSDEEDNEENYDTADGQNDAANNEEDSAVPSTSSTGQHSEIDAKLADFFKEIESMDADTTSTVDDGMANRQPEEAVSSTTEDERPVMSAAEGYEAGVDADYNGNEGDMYPWQACLDEATNCYYYWNVETNEVQWHPPKQLSSAAPDTQTADDDNSPSLDGEEKGEQGCQEDKDNNTAKEVEIEEKLSEDASENDSKEANSKDNSDDDLDSFQVVDTWEDRDNDTEPPGEKKAAVQKSNKSIDDEEVPAKRQKLVDVDEDSDDDFAVQLLEDTYEKGKQDILVEESMEMSEDEADKEKDDNKEEKRLLPPEVFEHLRTTAGTEEKKEEKSVTEEKKQKYNTEEEDYRLKILELTSVLTNKLDFLEVSRQGVSDLKILLIEMETRISDWREGALDSRHLVHKLCEADKQLKQYEESAAPPGWSCHWDRTHKRYYYTNKVTGDSQWEYPSEDTRTDAKEDTPSIEIPVQSSAATVTSNQSLAAWSFPAYVPMVQAPAMSVVLPTVPVVSSSAKTESFANPPVPGTDEGSEAVPFTASFSYEVEESPPPPPGTDDLPPLPPVESSAPPPPPPEPMEAPPPPPGDEMPTTSITKSASLSRPVVDYSDLDMASASPPPPPLPSAVPQSTETQLSTPLQETVVVGLPSPAGVATKPKVKKKKKTSKVGSALLSSKARKVSSLVQKWQSVKQQQQEPVLDSSEDDEEENDPVRQIEDWKKEHVESGQAAYNPNFQEIKGDWREKIRQRRAKAKSGAAADQKDT